MTVVDSAKSGGLISRVQNIILKPAAEWDVIDGETATVPGLITGYAAILAVLPAIGAVVGGLMSVLLFHVAGMILIVPALIGAALGYALSLLLVFIEGMIINAFATTFSGASNSVQATKVAAYSLTPFWVAGLFSFIPILGWLVSLAGFAWGCYVTHLGISKLMKPPADKAVVYTIVSILVTLVVYGIIAAIIGVIVGIITVAVAGAALTGGAAALSAVH